MDTKEVGEERGSARIGRREGGSLARYTKPLAHAHSHDMRWGLR